MLKRISASEKFVGSVLRIGESVVRKFFDKGGLSENVERVRVLNGASGESVEEYR